MRRLAPLALVWILGTVPARAELLTVASYDMPNGSGNGAGGTYNYWDVIYNGSGSTTTDAAPLSGGVGDLTDGVVAGGIWAAVENVAGTGPYVGWFQIDPTIAFHFSGAVSYGTLRIHVDDSNYGGVRAPVSVLVDDGQGHNGLFNVADVGSGTIRWLEFDISGLGLAGDVVSVTLNRGDVWVFASEVQFLGATAIPEPASIAMLAGAAGMLGLVGFARRRGVIRRPMPR